MIKNKEQARSYAVNFQNWVSTQSLSYSELFIYQNFLINIGKKYNLLREFKENGLI